LSKTNTAVSGLRDSAGSSSGICNSCNRNSIAYGPTDRLDIHQCDRGRLEYDYLALCQPTYILLSRELSYARLPTEGAVFLGYFFWSTSLVDGE
jgi:hypothetical protein